MSNTPLRKAERLLKWQGVATSFPPSSAWVVPAKSYRHNRRAQYAPNGIDTIVIHATAGGSSAGAMSVTQRGTASWHALVPDEDEQGHGKYLYHCVPDSGAAWHVLSSVRHPVDGLRNINDRSMGIEVVNWQDGRDQFSDWQLRITAQWVRYCWSNLGAKYLYTHAYLDPDRKSDPGGTFNWTRFMGYVLEGADFVTPVPAPRPIKVVYGGNVVECEPQWVGEQITVRVDPLLYTIDELRAVVPPGVIHTNGRAYVAELDRALPNWVFEYRAMPQGPRIYIKHAKD